MADDKKKALEEVFNQFDKDSSGKIDASELKDVLRAFYISQNQAADDAQIDADVGGILAACDSSKDGKIDKAEWFAFFKC